MKKRRQLPGIDVAASSREFIDEAGIEAEASGQAVQYSHMRMKPNSPDRNGR